MYLRSLCDKLGGVELGHHTFEHFVDDGGQHTLVIVLAQVLVEIGQVGGQWPRQHAQRDTHHLQVCRREAFIKRGSYCSNWQAWQHGT